ncbi:MAG: DUF4842 domain-containing protein [Alistipes sp.]|nr:DUF4842 domain-containing protein [Alistipes sp.]
MISIVNQIFLNRLLVIDKRSKEIHLKGQRPTSKFDYSLFGKELTDFVTPDNYVWMMVVDQEIPYPKEMASIEKAYPQFTAWVQAGGKLTYNWYDVTYRDANYMYIGKYK